MKRSNKLRKFVCIFSLIMIFGLVSILSACIRDSGREDQSSAVSSSAISQPDQGNPSSASVSSISISDNSGMYQDILDELDDLEDVINGLDGYTSEDLEVPTP
ncbi:MAG: hypothetical protein ACYCYM_02790 [Saccharofermentanales bacterium]